jgi:hypothetical protein
MKENFTQCPKCIGAKEVMVPKKTKGFKYEPCNLCDRQGVVNKEIADDFIFAIDEDNFENNDDW